MRPHEFYQVLKGNQIVEQQATERFHLQQNEALISVEVKDRIFVVFHIQSLQAETAQFVCNVIVSRYLEDKSALSTYQIKLVTKSKLFAKTLQKEFENSGLQLNKWAQKISETEIYIDWSNQLIKLSGDNPFKVMIVDDSSTIRHLLTMMFERDDDFTVVASVDHPTKVESELVKSQPDLITLDIHMPEMNGVEVLKKVISRYKVQTVMISSLSISEGPLVLEALTNGAVDYIQKPQGGAEEISHQAEEIMGRLREICIAKSRVGKAHHHHSKKTSAKSSLNFSKRFLDCGVKPLIAIGSSTGGTEANRQILTQLPSSIPPIIITQHIPAVFSKAFAQRLNDLCRFPVREAEHGEPLQNGHAYVLPGGFQCALKSQDRSGTQLIFEMSDSPPHLHHAPSVDVFFASLESLPKERVGAALLLTGMGADGAKGLLKLKNKGWWTITQTQESCVVWGMPRSAVELSAQCEELDLNQMAQWISERL